MYIDAFKSIRGRWPVSVFWRISTFNELEDPAKKFKKWSVKKKNKK